VNIFFVFTILLSYCEVICATEQQHLVGITCYLSLLSGVQYDARATTWKIGDMLWAKVSGHPWWPCIVLPDPDQSAWNKPLQSMTFHSLSVTLILCLCKKFATEAGLESTDIIKVYL